MRIVLAALLASAGCSTSRAPEVAARADAATVVPRAHDESAVRFVALGDTGMANADQYKVAAAMAKVCAARGCDFALLLGDNLYPSGAESADDPQWKEKFELPYAALQFPFWASLGNHDYGHRGFGDDFARPEGELAYARLGGKFRMPARRYHFAQGPAEFFAVDTNAARFGQNPGQIAEVAGWMAASKAPWKTAFSHFPYRSNGPHGNAGDYEPDSKTARVRYGEAVAKGDGVKALLDAAVCGKADLYLAGHDHSRQWLKEPCGGSTELVISGGGAEATSVSERNPAHFASASLGFAYVTVSAGELTAELIDAEGHTDLARTLRKSAP